MSGVEHGSGKQFRVRKYVRDVDPLVVPQLRKRHETRSPGCDFSDSMLVGISDYEFDAGQGSNFFRSALCITSRDDNLAIGVFAMDPANGRAGVLIGRCGDRTGVEHNNIGIRRRSGAEPSPLMKLPPDGGAVRLGRAAAEILYEEACHRFMLAQIDNLRILPREATPCDSKVP